jgi:hypothetical protein
MTEAETSPTKSRETISRRCPVKRDSNLKAHFPMDRRELAVMPLSLRGTGTTGPSFQTFVSMHSDQRMLDGISKDEPIEVRNSEGSSRLHKNDRITDRICNQGDKGRSRVGDCRRQSGRSSATRANIIPLDRIACVLPATTDFVHPAGRHPPFGM